MAHSLRSGASALEIEDGAIISASLGSLRFAAESRLPLVNVLYSEASTAWEARSWRAFPATPTGAVFDGKEATLRYMVADAGPVEVSVCITPRDDAFLVTISAVNHGAGVLVGVEAPILGGFQDTQGGRLFVPNRTGQWLAQPFERLHEVLVQPYPVPLSAQFVTFNTGTQGWAMSCLDREMRYKEFRLGGPDKQCSIVQYPFIPPNQEQALAPVLLSLYDGTWHRAADAYRTWFATWAEEPSVSPRVRALPVVDLLLIRARTAEDAYLKDTPKESEVGTYRHGLERVTKLRQQGAQAAEICGWFGEGHDSDYPEHAISGLMGEPEELAALARRMASEGLQVGYYLNARLANTTNPLYRRHPDWAVRQAAQLPQGVATQEHYGAETFDVLCPCAEGFAAHLGAKLTDLIEHYAADFVQLDQIGAAPALLCFDATHDHTTPATAWAEGYGAMLRRFYGRARALHPAFWFWTEGAWEGAGQFVDLSQGGFWPLHLDAQPFPALYHYTFPRHPLFGDAILGGVPFWRGGPANPAVVMEKNRAAFFARSRYMDTLGLTVDAPVRPDDGDRLSEVERGPTATRAAAAPLRWDGPHGWLLTAAGRAVSAAWHQGDDDLAIIAQNECDDAVTATVRLQWEGLRGKRLALSESLLETPITSTELVDGRLALGLCVAAHSVGGAYCRLTPEVA